MGVVTSTFKTHCHLLCVFCYTSSRIRGYYDAFAWAGCSSGGEWPLPPEGTARAEVFGVYHDLVKLLGDNTVLPSLQVRVVRASVQDTSMCVLFSEESSFPLGVAAAPGRLRLLDYDAA